MTEKYIAFKIIEKEKLKDGVKYRTIKTSPYKMILLTSISYKWSERGQFFVCEDGNFYEYEEVNPVKEESEDEIWHLELIDK